MVIIETLMKELCQYIVENINEEMTLDSIAAAFNYDKSYLLRQFKKTTGYTITQFINELRVYNSTDPLILTDDTILKIALSNGFNSQEYYTEKFTGIIGSSPLQFRKTFKRCLSYVENTNSIENLEELKETLSEIKSHQEYLNNISTCAPTFTKSGGRQKIH